MSDIVERLRELEAVERELAYECDYPPEVTANYRYAMICAEAADTITALRAENEQYQRSFDLRWDATMRAIKRWQEAHPGNDLNWPDHADLVVWLLERDAALRAENERLAAQVIEAEKYNGWHQQACLENQKLRTAAQALIDFYNGPLEAKRPDVFHRLMVQLNDALT